MLLQVPSRKLMSSAISDNCEEEEMMMLVVRRLKRMIAAAMPKVMAAVDKIKKGEVELRLKLHSTK